MARVAADVDQNKGGPRRSKRLLKGKSTGPTMFVEVPPRLRSMKEIKPPPLVVPTKVAPPITPLASPPPKALKRVKPSEIDLELKKLQRSFEKKEKEFERETKRQRERCRRKERELAAREAKIADERKALTDFVENHVADAADGIIQQLDDHFGCALCLDVVACPFMLSAYSCGHTFCGICLLKWSFSRLHECGAWHEPVVCPICRASAIITPPTPLRPVQTCPFLPNRSADNVVQELVGKLNSIGKATAPVADSSSSASSSSQRRKRQKSESREVKLPSSLADWADDGHKRKDWLERDRVGRTEMTTILAQWGSLQPYQFMTIKTRLSAIGS